MHNKKQHHNNLVCFDKFVSTSQMQITLDSYNKLINARFLIFNGSFQVRCRFHKVFQMGYRIIGGTQIFHIGSSILGDGFEFSKLDPGL